MRVGIALPVHAIHDNGPPPPCPEQFNLAQYVLEAGRATPEKTALVVVGAGTARALSYEDLAGRVDRAAGRLVAAGLPKGARILVRLGNTVDFPIAFLAATAVDLVPVVVSSLLTEPEVQAVLAHISPSLVIADPKLPLGPTPCPVLTPEDLSRSQATADPIPGGPNRPAYVVFTSGTAAQPRAVLHAHRAVWARRMMWRDWYGLDPSDRVLHAGAFNWTYTLGTGLLDPWAAGATALIPEPGLAPADLARAVTDHDVTIFAAAPALYRRILNAAPEITAPALRHGLSAGEKMSDTIRDRWSEATGTLVHEAFGMSECSTFLSGSPAAPALPGTIGRAQSGRQIAVLDDQGDPVMRDTPGRLAVHHKDQGLMLGYLAPGGQIDLPLAGPWYVTNDTVTLRADTHVVYEGRAEDLLNPGGVRVSPLEVEAVLAAYPGITDCAVAEVRPKPDLCIIAGFYVANEAVDEASLSAHMSKQLARYKCPRLFHRVDALPRNANGKLKRRALREAWEAENGQA